MSEHVTDQCAVCGAPDGDDLFRCRRCDRLYCNSCSEELCAECLQHVLDVPSSADTDYIRSVAEDCRKRRADQDEAANVLATCADDLDAARADLCDLQGKLNYATEDAESWRRQVVLRDEMNAALQAECERQDRAFRDLQINYNSLSNTCRELASECKSLREESERRLDMFKIARSALGDGQ